MPTEAQYVEDLNNLSQTLLEAIDRVPKVGATVSDRLALQRAYNRTVSEVNDIIVLWLGKGSRGPSADAMAAFAAARDEAEALLAKFDQW